MSVPAINAWHTVPLRRRTERNVGVLSLRPLERDEIEWIWTIDRSEVHHHIYRLVGGNLVRTPAYFDLRGWPPEQVAHDTPLLYACFDGGGAFVVAADSQEMKFQEEG